MKKAMILTLTVFILCFSSVKAAAIDKLTITGQGKISVPADTVTVSFSVEVKTASYADSMKKSEAIGRKVVSAVKEYGSVSEESYFSYEDAGCGKWCVSRSYVLTSSQPDKTDKICSALTESGATAICFIGFSLSDSSGYEVKALEAAVKDARARAAAVNDSLSEREMIDYGSCVCTCCESSEKRGYVVIECTVNIIYY